MRDNEQATEHMAGSLITTVKKITDWIAFLKNQYAMLQDPITGLLGPLRS
jgi:hypothetical protein